MKMLTQFDEDERHHSVLGLVWLTLGLAIGASTLYVVAGPPHLPSELPSGELIAITLRGSSVPYETLAYLLTTTAWVIWLWIAGSLLLRMLVVGADAVAHGAAWVGVLRSISDRLTLPIVRRLVDGALVALVVINLVGRSVSSAAAAPPSPAITISVADFREPTTPRHQATDAQRHQGERTVEYTVQPGDTLWGIAERFYGAGDEYPRLVTANAGRQMPDGRRFTRAGVIYPGWVLLVPLPSHAPDEADAQLHYVVEAGDTLRGIAARHLGDETRWPEIFELNRGTARLEDGRVLTDPDLIWPGLWLKLPRAAATGEEPQTTAQPTFEPSEEAPVVTVPTPAPPRAATAPVAPAIVPTPPPAPTPVATVEPQSAAAESSASPLISGVAGLAAVAGGAALLMRRRVRRSLNEPPIPREPDPHPNDDFVEPELARALAHQLHGGEVEPVVVIAEEALRFLAEHRVDDVSVVTARQSRHATTLTLDTGLLVQPRLIELAEDFAARLGGKGLASLTSDHDVVLQVSSPKLVGLLARPSERRMEVICLLPLGVLRNGEMLYANWRELGHALIAGLPGGGTDVILTSIISALTARCHPDDLRIWTIASHRVLPTQLQQLPHQCASFIDPEDDVAVADVLRQVRTELIRRMRAAEQDGTSQQSLPPKRPEIVLVVGELGEVTDEGATLELIGVHGPAHGVRLLAATTNPSTLGDDVLTHFGTRLVLQTLDDEESIQLLGQPGAADLGSGDLVLRIGGRVPVRMRGFRVSTDHLDELVRLMRDAYGSLASMARSAVVDSDAREADRQATVDPEQGSPAVDRYRPEGHAGYPGIIGEPVAEAIPPAGAHGITPPEDGSRATADDGVAREELAHRVVASRGAASGDRPRSNGDQGTVALKSVESADTDDQRAVATAEDEGRSTGHVVGTAASDVIAVPNGRAADAVDLAEAGPLVQVRCFGEFEVRSGGHAITPSLEDRVSFKSFELLAFLAAHPDGAVSKEKLLAALWPDADEERASNRMRVAMTRLRALLARQVPGLPTEAVRCERDGTCRLDTRLISSDVHQFLSLCRSVSKLLPEEAKPVLQRARALYRGDLLAGGSTRFYEWVDDPGETGVSLRAHYREEYIRATLRLARLFSQEGQAALAVPLYKGLLKAEPTLEDVVRELYRCYQQLGDLSSLIREDRHLRQALQQAYYDPEDPNDDPKHYQPETETVELFNRIREELEARRYGPSVKGDQDLRSRG